MSQTLMYQCKKCKDWFESPIQLDMRSFENSTIGNNTVECRGCGELNVINKDNLKFM